MGLSCKFGVFFFFLALLVSTIASELLGHLCPKLLLPNPHSSSTRYLIGNEQDYKSTSISMLWIWLCPRIFHLRSNHCHSVSFNTRCLLSVQMIHVLFFLNGLQMGWGP